ncbi:MAG: Na+/H+ antiporter subunit E [Lachnospiraceae bacterium]|nr:Na+/H+ antiporter subunit E [Lachnospiraceae bacterium]
MFLLFFILWIIFNGRFTVEIALFGVAVSAAMYAFCCRFMDFSIRKDLAYVKKVFLFLKFLAVLTVEIIKANIAMGDMILHRYEKDLNPVIFKMKTKLRYRTTRVLLANAITLTPGTITIRLKDDELIIHAVDNTLAIEDDGNFIFEELLLKLEEPV